MNFLLKIVEGPNKGAEIALVEGVAVTLGKGDDCDIVLADPTMPDAPLSVEASADGVTVGGEPLEPFSVKTFGSTSFAVGPADAPWGELKWPKPEDREDSTEPPPPRTPEPPNHATTEPPNDQDTEPSSRRRGGCFGCLFVLLGLLLVLVALVWLFWDAVKPRAESLWEKLHADRSGSGDSPTAQTSGSGTQFSNLREIAAKYALSLAESDGRARISGNLKTRRDRLAATAEAYGAQPGVELDLSDDESLRASAEDALFTLTEGALKVVAATNRVVSIAGSSRSPVLLKAAQRRRLGRGHLAPRGPSGWNRDDGRGAGERESRAPRPASRVKENGIPYAPCLRNIDNAVSLPRDARRTPHHGRRGDRGLRHRRNRRGQRHAHQLDREVHVETVKEPVRLMEIEKELAGPRKEAALAKYDAVLSALAERIDAAMQAGLPPDEFPKVEALKEANTVARKILRLTVRVDGEARKA